MDQSASTRSSTQIAINRRANMGSEVAPMQIDRVRSTTTTTTAATTTATSTTETTSPTITARTPVRPTTVRPALNTTMPAEQYRDDYDDDDGGGGAGPGPRPPKVCFNGKCLTTDSPSWKPGWLLRSGRIADLCDTCGSAYERLCFCETFHRNDSGWRACISCQQAYFPAISQPEGVLIRIQDITGKEWLFQFRFWPNNNSRMYVLEGVTPCIQSLRLVAGDTVTFSRLDPEGKLIMGYRRAPSSLSSQDVQTSTTDALLPSVTSAGMESTIEITELFSRPMAYAGDCPMDAQTSLLSSSSIFEAGDGQCDAEKKILNIKGTPHYASVILDEKKRTNKNWLLDVEDPVDESKFSWQDIQELFQPPPNVRPSVVTIEGHDFEEYEVPPVFGMRTIYMSRQGWASCTAPQDLKNEEFNRLFPGKEVRKEETQEVEIQAPANLEEHLEQLSSPVATTKHPRHRPGCSCIVCTQAPSGKGPKHKPSCTCNMCVIASRRFQTKMSNRRKGQSEEGQKGNAMKKHIVRTGGKEIVSWVNPRSETQFVHEDGRGKQTLFEALDRASPNLMSNLSSSVNRPSLSEGYPSKPTSGAEEHMLEETLFDLNSQPEQDDESFKVTGGETMTMLLQNANHTLERYLQQQGIRSLSCLSKIVEDFHCK